MPKKETVLYSIYGARVSKDGTRLNISLVNGEGDAKQWATISVKLDNTSKVQVELQEDNASILIPMLKPTINENDVPF